MDFESNTNGRRPATCRRRPGVSVTRRLPHAVLAVLVAVTLAEAAHARERVATPADFGFAVPRPAPRLPAEFDAFAPEFRQTDASAPQIAEFTRTAGPNQTVVATGSRMSGIPGFTLFTQRVAGKGRELRVNPLTRDKLGAALRIPGTAENWSMYLLWPRDGAGYGTPVAINRTEAWWVGPQPASPGGTTAVYGRNLANANGTEKSWVYLKKTDGGGRWVPVLQVNPYRVEFRIPANMELGSYEVWIHNGHGGEFGWSGPISLSVTRSPWAGQPSRTFNVRDYGARGDGRTDDEAAIQRAVEAAGRAAPATVYFPAGTYMVSRGFLPPNNVRWLGAGPDKTIIRAMSGFRRNEDRGYALLFGENQSYGNNIEIRGLTLDQAGNPGRTGFPIWLRWVRNVKITNARVISRPGPFFNFEFSRQILISRTGFIGDGGYLGDARQVFIDSSTFRLTFNANSALSTQGGGGEVAITNNVIRDFDPTKPEGTASGRFFVSQPHSGGTEHYYFAGNRTIDLAPPVQDWSGFDSNSGEQILFEQCCAGHVQTIASATRTTFRLNNFRDSLDIRKPTDIMVNWGPGVGQVRRIVAYDSATGVFTVDRPFAVVPPAGSNVSLAATASRIVIYKNQFDGKSNYATKDTASCAVQLYNSTDVIIDGNLITNMRGGIEFWATGNVVPEIDAVYFNYAINNVIRDSYDAFADYTMYFTAAAPNTVGHIGNLRRGNRGTRLTNAGISIRTWDNHTGGAFKLNVFEQNRFQDTRHGLIAGNLYVRTQTPLEKTILSRNTFVRGNAPYSGSVGLMAPDAATWVILNSSWQGFEKYNP